MRIAGINNLSYTPESVVNAPTGNAEVMLVLDSTGSMALDGKMDALKVSANKFVEDVLKSNALEERVKIGITPFAQYVNVGMDNRNASWMDVPDDYTTTETIETRDVISRSGCSETTYTDSEGIERTTTSCTDVEYGPIYEKEITRNYKWNGCAGSRNYPRNLDDSDFSFKVPGLLNTWCPKRITQLTADEATLKSEINALYPSGSTYIPTGLTWGLRALSSGDPFDDGVSYADAISGDVQKVIVLMSDGENQSSINPGKKAWHNGNDKALANSYTQEVCDNIKDENILLFTIGFGDSIPQTTLDLLKSCSTDGTNYYNATDGAALTAAFANITSKLAALYLSK
jgi:Mg-chelatase subunit ChlD